MSSLNAIVAPKDVKYEITVPEKRKNIKQIRTHYMAWTSL